MANTIAALLESTRLNKTDAKALLAYLLDKHLGWPRSALISRDQESLPNELLIAWQSLEAQRASGVPVAYLTGRKGFHGIELKVNEAVLIPRPETELLVDLALEEMQRIHAKVPNQVIQILDLGTGSGAIALAIAHECAISKASINLGILGVDQSSDAIELARENAKALGLNHIVEFLQSNWYDAIPDRYQTSCDVIVSNPPYIQKDDPHLHEGDLRYEPRSALSDDGDGLSCIREIVSHAHHYLKPGGLIAIEHGYDQAATVATLLESHAFHDVGALADLAGHLRVTQARK
ncbi:peptide chain release factor N(5)-glutamine methyltransferase [Polynucleobacter sp. MWH-UH24A]|uniref:peptide chain release factor N(5)-glutamine methyltransferase n=1 Tax=Polynucleobacter sp. MWH-UH24A TaxID=2689110 RepID=UPI001BFD4018|nr:peptide chain release factor N(5)-glutamine methyltransferase [Polynucleobacter sp. MWH-UH24A]QWD76233.1 peptide chain release factor N(5)-glutamine methyltransferase [Polynucleobacter sp. MWH-UH24A]